MVLVLHLRLGDEVNDEHNNIYNNHILWKIALSANQSPKCKIGKRQYIPFVLEIQQLHLEYNVLEIQFRNKQFLNL